MILMLYTKILTINSHITSILERKDSEINSIWNENNMLVVKIK